MSALRSEHGGESGEALIPRAPEGAAVTAGWSAPVGAGSAWIAHNVVDDQSVPDEQHDQRADAGADQAGALVEPVPSDGLTDEGGEESARDPEQCRQDETARLVRPRRQEASDDAGDEPDDDDPDDVRHHDLPRVDARARASGKGIVSESGVVQACRHRSMLRRRVREGHHKSVKRG
jgi:hypothetical protein